MLQIFRNLRILPIIRQRCIHTESSDEMSLFTSRDFVDMKVEDFRRLYQNDEAKKEEIKSILDEYEFCKYNSMGRVPSKIALTEMQMILEEGISPPKRAKLLNFLFKREMAKLSNVLKKQREKEVTRARRASKMAEFADRDAPRTGLLDSNGNLVYGLWHNSLFVRIPETRMKMGLSSSRLISAAMYGRKLIFDFGYEEYMRPQSIRSVVEQVQSSYGLNRFLYDDPLDLWFCNFNKNSKLGKYTHGAIQNLDDGSMITVKEDCFMNHFDKSRLVYLSPNAKEPLGKIHKSDDIYIIGVYNDKGNVQPVSYRKAIKLGIRTRSLPIDSHVVWQGASKSLCVNHVTGILLEALATNGDWGAAFVKHIPNRKIKPMELVIQEEQARAARRSWNPTKAKHKFNFREDLGH